MSLFTWKPPRGKVAENQERVTGNPPIDMVAPFNYPYKLKDTWHIFAVEGNLWRVRLAEDQTMTGANVDTSVAEGNWNFEHVIRDVYWYQYVTATGVRDGTAITWEWARRIGGDYYPIRASTNNPIRTVAIEDIYYRSNYEDYRWRFNGVATNSVALEVWVEVLRI
jgi:hypothetical protein